MILNMDLVRPLGVPAPQKADAGEREALAATLAKLVDWKLLRRYRRCRFASRGDRAGGQGRRYPCRLLLCRECCIERAVAMVSRYERRFLDGAEGQSLFFFEVSEERPLERPTVQAFIGYVEHTLHAICSPYERSGWLMVLGCDDQDQPRARALVVGPDELGQRLQSELGAHADVEVVKPGDLNDLLLFLGTEGFSDGNVQAVVRFMGATHRLALIRSGGIISSRSRVGSDTTEITMRMRPKQMRTVAVDSLRVHPQNADIYGEPEGIEELAQSIRKCGMVQPILISTHGEVVAGHRRLLAAKLAGLKRVPVIMYDRRREDAVVRALVESNRQQRVRTPEHMANEAAALMRIESEEAKQRRKAGLKRGTKAPVVATVPQRDRKTAEVATVPQRKKGKARDAVAKKLGVSPKTAAAAAAVANAIKKLASEGRAGDAERLRLVLNKKGVQPANKLAKKLLAAAKTTSPAAEAQAAISVAQWDGLDEAQRREMLAIPAHGGFDEPDDDILFATASWTPFEGADPLGLHDVILYPSRLHVASTQMPSAKAEADVASTQMPSAKAEADVAHRNVLVCPDGDDLFAPEIPEEWRQAILAVITSNPHWNFLIRTRHAERLRGRTFPENLWIGAVVMVESDVGVAEAEFHHITETTTWLCIEPMLGPIEFPRMEVFDWIVIGGAAATDKTPRWSPPHRWIHMITAAADKAKIPVYERAGLYASPLPANRRRCEYPGMPEAPEVQAPDALLKRVVYDEV